MLWRRLVLLFLFILESNYVWIIHALPKADPNNNIGRASIEGNNFSFITAKPASGPAQMRNHPIGNFSISSFYCVLHSYFFWSLGSHHHTPRNGQPIDVDDAVFFPFFSDSVWKYKFEGFRGNACVGWAEKHNHQGG